MEDLLRDVTRRAVRYHAGLNARGVAPSSEAVNNLARFREPFPQKPADAQTVLALLDEVGSPDVVVQIAHFRGGNEFIPPTSFRWARLRRKLPPTNEELRVVAGNVAPYMR